MMEVVADPRQADPEGEGDHGELDEGSEDLDDPVEGPDAHVVHTGLFKNAVLDITRDFSGMKFFL